MEVPASIGRSSAEWCAFLVFASDKTVDDSFVAVVSKPFLLKHLFLWPICDGAPSFLHVTPQLWRDDRLWRDLRGWVGRSACALSLSPNGNLWEQSISDEKWQIFLRVLLIESLKLAKAYI